ncbi:MAG: hypothetical protein KAR08_02435 [Candidatus Heimdallarchaeota archaeon]|nr:hypothetical protein [Candidatus Heimdallarchaeota archaeon]
MNASDSNELKTEDTSTSTVIELKPHELEQISKKKEGKILSTLRQIFRAIFSWEAIHLMLSHHPFCEVFDPHVFKIGKLRLCRGCFLSYPPLYALVSIFIFWEAAREFFLLEAISIMDNLWWFVIGFGILTFGARWLGRYSLFIKDIAKFSRGAWTGFLVMVIISQHWGFKIGAILIVIGGMTYLSLHRGKDMERTCDECEWHSDFNSCPGWEGMSDKLFQTVPPITESIPPVMPEQEKQDTE